MEQAAGRSQDLFGFYDRSKGKMFSSKDPFHAQEGFTEEQLISDEKAWLVNVPSLGSFNTLEKRTNPTIRKMAGALKKMSKSMNQQAYMML